MGNTSVVFCPIINKPVFSKTFVRLQNIFTKTVKLFCKFCTIPLAAAFPTSYQNKNRLSETQFRQTVIDQRSSRVLPVWMLELSPSSESFRPIRNRANRAGARMAGATSMKPVAVDPKRIRKSVIKENI